VKLYNKSIMGGTTVCRIVILFEQGGSNVSTTSEKSQPPAVNNRQYNNYVTKIKILFKYLILKIVVSG